MGKTSRKATKHKRGPEPTRVPPSLTDQAEVARLLGSRMQQIREPARKTHETQIERLFNRLGPIDEALEEVRQGADS
jgi:hypothetical protein